MMMKNPIRCSSALVLGLLLMFSPSAAFCESHVSMVLQYDAFRDDASPENTGYQLAVPLQWSYERGSFSAMVETAYAHTEISREDDDGFSQDGFSDTFVGAVYKYVFPTEQPTKLVMDVTLNLPTGEENLDDDYLAVERILRRDRYQRGDLFRVDILGEGLNLGGALGLEHEFGANTFGLYGGYVSYGAYDLNWNDSTVEYDPGDEIFARGVYSWKNGARNLFHAYLGYSWFGVDSSDGADALQIGDKLSVGADLQAALQEKLDTIVSVLYIKQFHSEEVIDGEMEEESDNSNGDEFFATLKLIYHAHPRLSLPLVGELRYYGESEREREDLELPYEGRRTRYSLGAGFTYRLTPAFAFRGMGSYFNLDCEPSSSVTEARVFQGANLDFGMAYTF